ncbi:MAG TPA: hypothetical protein VNE17_04015 [Nitrolancea sp.]|nr:hypothetical protein [Nitrolancea sp.]
MSTRESTAVHISSRADVDSLVERLPQMRDEQVLISIDEESDALVTAAEFYRILTKARSVNVSLSIATDDGLRRELARMLGWVVLTPFSTTGSRGDTEDFPTVGGDTVDPDADESNFHTTTDLATYRPKYGRIPSAPSQPPRKSLTGTIIVDPRVAEKLTAQNGAADLNGTRPGVRARPAERDDGDDLERPRFSRRRLVTLVAAIGAPVIVIAVVAWILSYMLPTATLTLVPVENTINSDLTYGVALPGTNYDIKIDPVSISHTSTFDKQIPTTGERFVPDGTAGGPVLFTNATLQAVTIPSGTALMGKNGMTYYTQQAIEIPAADPFGSLSFGSASVAVAAGTAGQAGNAGAGTVVGQLTTGIYFNNQGAIAGGTMKRIAVVSQADVDALKQAATSDLATRSPQEFAQSLDKSLDIVPDSQITSDPTFEFSLQPGQDGTAVSVHATQTMSAEQFDPVKLNALAKDAAARQLAAKAGPNEIILGDTVAIGQPVALPGGLSFTRHATAQTRAVISEDEQKSLEHQVVGKSKADVARIVASMKDVKSYNVVIKTSWLKQSMPEVLSHIKIVVANNDGTNTQP